jgi:sulfatase maturation enzyme AslB (radical SAM superfamily)
MPNNNVICPIPWNHIGIQQNGDYRICCQNIFSPFGRLKKDDTIANIKNTSIDDIRNFKEIKDLRINMINGIRDPLCTLCYQEEDVGVISKRSKMLQLYDNNFAEKTQIDGKIDTTEFPLRYIDIRFGNLCNLKCRYCGPTDSSLWYEDYASMQPVQPVVMNFYNSTTYEIKKINNVWEVDSLDFKWYEDEKFWSQIKELIPFIDRYYFTGGEPTINKTHFDLLQLIIDMNYAKDVTLEYNTNMWAIPDKLYSQWSYFKSIEVGCSIDGIENMANYLRPPSTWNRLEKNLDKLGNHELNNITAAVSTTISIFNILNFIDLTKWLIQKNYKNITNVPAFHMLVGPAHMSIQVLPNYIKKDIERKYIKFYEEMDIKFGWNRRLGKELHVIYSSIINFMNLKDESHLIPDLKNSIQSVDSIRDQKLETTIPWLYDVLESYKADE